MSFVPVDGTSPTLDVEDDVENELHNDEGVIIAGLDSVPLPPSSPPSNPGESTERETEMGNSVPPMSTSTLDTRRKTRSMTLYETRQETNESTEVVVQIIERKTTKRMRTTTSDRDLISDGNENTSNTETPSVSPPTGEQQSCESDPASQKPHICKDTKKSLLKRIRREHTAKREREKKHECEICKMKFLYPSDLRTHTRIHKGDIDKLIRCPDCGVGFNSAKAIPYHRRQVHKNNHNRDHLSENCNPSFVIYPHIYIIRGSGNPSRYRYRCKNCRVRFRYKETILFHQFCKRKSELERYTCETCGKAFGFRKTLISHMTTHNDDKAGGRILCEICKMPFSSIKGLKSHSKCHTGDNLTKCSECDAGFNNEQSLFLHLCLHKGRDDCQSFKCRKCGDESGNESYFTAHLLSHTDQGSSIPAPILQNAGSKNSVDAPTPAKRKRGLHDLANSVHIHAGKKFHLCDVCNAQFPTSWKLRRHKSCHSKISGGGHRFKCDLCGVKLNSRRALTCHVLRHKAEKGVESAAGQFQCQICETSFKLKLNRDQHIRLEHQPKIFLRRLDRADAEYPVLSGNPTAINQKENTTTIAPNHLETLRLPSPPPPQNLETNDVTMTVTLPAFPSSSTPVEPHPIEAFEWNRPLPSSHSARKEGRVHVVPNLPMQPQQTMSPVKKSEPQRLEHATVFVVALPMPIIYLPTNEVFLIDQNFEWKSLPDPDTQSLQKKAFGFQTTDKSESGGACHSTFTSLLQPDLR